MDPGFVSGPLKSQSSQLLATGPSVSVSLQEVSLLPLSLPLNSKHSLPCLPLFPFLPSSPGFIVSLDVVAAGVCFCCQASSGLGFGEGTSEGFVGSSLGCILCSLSNLELLALDFITNQSCEKYNNKINVKHKI